MDLVLLTRLESAEGFTDFAQALDFAHRLQGEGVNAVAESPPGDPSASAYCFHIKVPADQMEKAAAVLKSWSES